MQILVLTRSTRTYGGNCTYTLAGHFLQSGLVGYGSALREIYLLANFRDPIGAAPEPGPYADAFYRRLRKLPTVRFFRKKARAEIEYETKVADASFLKQHSVASADMFNRVLCELAEVLHLVDKRLKDADGFDLAAFHHAVAGMVKRAPASDGELREIEERLEREEKQRVAAMDPWERLGLDWDDFHPDARGILNDPFFWEQDNDHSPHGNDTGADLLMNFRRWNRRNPDRPADELAARLLRDWDIGQMRLESVGQDAMSPLLLKDPLTLFLADEAMIAAAFAAIKLRGRCDELTRDLAQKAIERERLPMVIAARAWTNPLERIEKLGLLAAALARAPQ